MRLKADQFDAPGKTKRQWAIPTWLTSKSN